MGEGVAPTGDSIIESCRWGWFYGHAGLPGLVGGSPLATRLSSRVGGGDYGYASLSHCRLVYRVL